MLLRKFRENLETHFNAGQVDIIAAAFENQEALEAMSVTEFMELWLT